MYKETIRCPFAVALTFSVMITFVIVFLVLFLMIGPSKVTMKALPWIVVWSIPVFCVSFCYTAVRYSIKLKVYEGILDHQVRLSIRGVGKGSLLWIPLDHIVSCEPCGYESPMKGFILLVLSSNPPWKKISGGSAVTVPLPGYSGSGIRIEYKNEANPAGEERGLILPTNDPQTLCGILSGC